MRILAGVSLVLMAFTAGCGKTDTPTAGSGAEVTVADATPADGGTTTPADAGTSPAAAPVAASGPNLLANPGFEADGDWDIWMGEVLDVYKHGGNRALHGWGFDGDGDCGGWQKVPVSAGDQVTFRAYIMSPNESGMHKSPLAGGASAFLEIEWWQGETKLGNVMSDQLSGASDWKEFSISGTAPAGADSARVVCKLKSAKGSSGDAYFDDLSVTVTKP